MHQIVATESGFNQFAIGVNGANRRSYSPTSAAEAAAIANELIAEGHSIDLGLGQINNKNLEWLELTTETVFDPCKNLAAAETVLRDGYERARAAGSDPEDAFHKALSAYNTGSFERGFTNGYVERVLGQSVQVASATEQEAATPTPPQSPSWDVFNAGNSSQADVFN